jgi:hypothetical protein
MKHNYPHRITNHEDHQWDDLRNLLKEKFKPQADNTTRENSTEDYWARFSKLTGTSKEQFQSQFRKI